MATFLFVFSHSSFDGGCGGNCSSLYSQFWGPELQAVAAHFGGQVLTWHSFYALASFPDLLSAQRCARRCMLVVVCLRNFGIGNTLQSAIEKLEIPPVEGWENLCLHVHGRKLSKNDKAIRVQALRDEIRHIGDAGTPAGSSSSSSNNNTWVVFGNNDEDDAIVIVGEEVEVGGKGDYKAFSLRKRGGGFGPTSMNHVLTFMMTNFAQLQRGDLVLDPFIGSGSIAVACAARGGLVLGSDYDAAAMQGTDGSTCGVSKLFQRYNIPPPLSLVQADITRFPFGHHRSKVDCIVCDPPYGIRHIAKVHQQQHLSGLSSENSLLVRLCQYASSLLVNGGRLVFWTGVLLSTLRQGLHKYAQSLAELVEESLLLSPFRTGGSISNLQLLHVLPINLESGDTRDWTRVLVVMEATKDTCNCSKRILRPEAAISMFKSTSSSTLFAQLQHSRQQNYKQIRSRQVCAAEEIDVWRAAWMGDVEAVKLYVEATQSMDPLDDGGRTPLFMAAGMGKSNVVSLLLGMQADPNIASTQDNETALMRASRFGRDDVVKALLQCPMIDTDAVDVQGDTAMHWAARFGHAAILHLLAAHNPKAMTRKNEKNQLPIAVSASRGRVAAVEFFLQVQTERGGDNNSDDDDDDMVSTALLLAARWGHTEVMHAVMGHANVKLDVTDDHGNTPLHLAAKWGREECVKMLLDKSVEFSLQSIPNHQQQLPKDVAANETILALFS